MRAVTQAVNRLKGVARRNPRVAGARAILLSFLGIFSRFGRIRRATGGYLNARVYRVLWLYAKRAPQGILVDIGPGQGASTVALGLAAKKRFDKPRVLTFDTFKKSGAMRHGDDVKRNVAELQKNLRKFRVDGYVQIHVVPERTPQSVIQHGSRISVLFIDADGALDRDFSALYTFLAPGATVVVDDFDPRINNHGRKFLGFSELQLESLVEGKGVTSLMELVPFGKHHTTWLFVTIMLKHNLVSIEKIIGNTVFLRVPDERPPIFSQDLLEHEFKLARRYIYDSFSLVRGLHRTRADVGDA